MAATVHIVSVHGATGGTTANVEGGSARFKMADNDTVNGLNPIPIPPSGTTYSYIKQFQLT